MILALPLNHLPSLSIAGFLVTKHVSQYILPQFKVKTIRYDNAAEFKGREADSFHSDKNITPSYSSPLDSKGDAYVERAHQTINTIARCLRLQANFPKKFWPEMVKAASFILHRTPSDGNLKENRIMKCSPVENQTSDICELSDLPAM